MKTLKIIVLLLLINFVSLSFARTVPKEKAGKVAVNWLNRHDSKSLQYQIKNTLFIKNDGDTLLYIFNMSPSGYVIISADDVAIPIIGYSFKGKFLNQNVPPALKDWLEMRKKEIIQARKDNIKPENKTTILWESYLINYNKTAQVREVEPLLQTTWDQKCYYNELCPEDEEGSCGHTVTGCVATAMAQIMKYWEYPHNGLGEHEYLHDEYGWIYANFLKTVYEWTEMPNNVTSSNLPTATLMFHCGVSVDMDYGPYSSSACNGKPPYAFTNYFGYSDSLEEDYKLDFSDSEWEAKLRTDLDNGRPLYYSGGGHAFVCDGYQGENYFHFNWGWSGEYDGYYYLDDLTPGPYDFTDNQMAIFYIKPKYKPISEFIADTTQGAAPLTVSFFDRSLSYYQTIVSWEWDFGDGNTSTEQSPIHTYQSSGTYDVKLKVTTEKGDTSSIIKEKYININPNDHIGHTWYVSVNSGSDYDGNGNEDKPLASIQYAINIAEAGDTLIIENGTYYENLDLKGKNLIIASRYIKSNDPSIIDNTIIDGENKDVVISYTNHEDSTSKLMGLVVQNGEGGGIHCYYASPTFEHLKVQNNHNTLNGGGILFEFSNSVVKNCEIRNNQADYHGGGIEVFYGDSLKIYNTKIENNLAYGNGGGLQEQWAILSLINSSIANNEVYGIGGAMEIYGGEASIINSTIVNNSTTDRVGGIYHRRGAHSTIENSILWGNLYYQIEFSEDEEDTLEVSYSDIQGGQENGINSPFENDVIIWNDGNIDMEPDFVNIGEYPFQLDDDSPCIDAGNPDTTGLDLPEYDMAGHERVYNERIDMGAFENDGSGPAVKTIFVDISGSDENGAGTEDNPYRTIQKAIDMAYAGDTVLVKPGKYVENIKLNGKNVILGSLFLTTNDTSYINTTIIDGDSSDSVIRFATGEDTTCLITGFTVTNGAASTGGGIYIDNSSPQLKKLKIEKNVAENYGGGISISQGNPILKQLYIYKNKSQNANGGGISIIKSSSPILENIKLVGNKASERGGGIYCENKNIELKNCVFQYDSSYYGSGISFCNSDSKLINCTFYENNGNCIYLDHNCYLTVINSILWNSNWREIYFTSYNDPDTVEVKYSDIQDTDSDIGIYTNNHGEIIHGNGNINSEPQFVNSGTDPCQLSSSSPCRNAGDPDTSGLGLPEYDLAGNPRISENRIDMGSYEYQEPSTLSKNSKIPKTFFLMQNYPNPFNPNTTIEYGLPKTSDVKIEIFNVLGQKIYEHSKIRQKAGYYKISFNGSRFASGIYFYRIVAGNFVKVKKMVVLK